MKPLGTSIYQNSQFYYPSEPFNFHHFNVRHPVCGKIFVKVVFLNIFLHSQLIKINFVTKLSGIRHIVCRLLCNLHKLENFLLNFFFVILQESSPMSCPTICTRFNMNQILAVKFLEINNRDANYLCPFRIVYIVVELEKRRDRLTFLFLIVTTT